MTPPNLVTLTEPRSAAAEAYRTLRTNLMFSGVERKLNTLLVTTAAQSEDKSLLLANLAVTFAQAGSPTIIVDADLRRPAQHTLWNISGETGLTTMILDEAAFANPPLVATPIPGLWVLPAGALPPVPADVLSSQRLLDVIAALKGRAQTLLFDCPPVLAAADASILATRMDGVILATRAGTTRRDHVARARQTLERVGARLLGAALTNAPREDVGRYTS